MRKFFTRYLAVLALIGTSLAPVPVAVAQEDDGTSNARQTASTEEVDDIEAAMEQVNTKPAKPSRLSKEKWSKINYSRVYKRRQNNGLPAEIRLAPQAVRSRDPALQVADITSTVPQPEAESVLLTYIDSFSGNIPTSMPDISILFNDADVANAKAVSTGQIVFQAGILDDVKYIDQAAFLLGHELAHIAYDHFKNEENRRTLNTVVTTATLIAEGGDSQRASNSDAFVSYLVFSEFLLGPQWSRSNETAADELGIDLLVSSGMSLEGARSMFRALAADEAERARLLEERCGGKPGLGRFFGNAFAISRDKPPLPPECGASGNLLGSVLTSITKTHANAEARLNHANEYIASRYPGYSDPGMSDLPPGLKVAIAADGPVLRSSYASRAIDLLNAGEVELAAHYVIASYDAKDKTTVKPRLAMYYMLKRAGRLKEAVDQLDIAVAGGQAAKAVYLLALQERLAVASALDDQTRSEQVGAMFDAVRKRYSNNPLNAIAAAESLAAGKSVDIAHPTARLQQEMLPKARAAYEHALKLAREAQPLFKDNQEFVLQELEIERLLGTESDTRSRFTECSGSSDAIIRDYCKDILKRLSAASAR